MLEYHKAYAMIRPVPQDNVAESWVYEFFSLFWLAGVVFGARVAPHPWDIILSLWTVGMIMCLPVTAWIGCKRDHKTTICREMNYFLRRGIVGIRIFAWPISLIVSCFTQSERQGYVDQLCWDYRVEHSGAKIQTIVQMVDDRASKIDGNSDVVQRVTTQALDVAAEVPAAACRTTAVAAALTGVACAQDPAANAPSVSPTTSIVLARTGFNLQQPYMGTYRMVEFFQVRDKWIYPDVGCVDFATGKYRECFVGLDRTLLNTKHVTVTGAGYFVQATGPLSHGARYIWLNPIIDLRLTSKVTGQISYFPYVPINRSATKQQVLERAKLERKLGNRWKIGAGYGGYQFGNGPWQSRPFVTATFAASFGSLELWPFQKIPAGAQAQLRLTFIHTTHNRR